MTRASELSLTINPPHLLVPTLHSHEYPWTSTLLKRARIWLVTANRAGGGSEQRRADSVWLGIAADNAAGVRPHRQASTHADMREINRRIPDTRDNACKAGLTRPRDPPADQTRLSLASRSSRPNLCEDDRQGNEKEERPHHGSWR